MIPFTQLNGVTIVVHPLLPHETYQACRIETREQFTLTIDCLFDKQKRIAYVSAKQYEKLQKEIEIRNASTKTK